MKGAIAIKLPKHLSLAGASIVKFKDGRLFLKTPEALHRILEFPLEIIKYVIDPSGQILTEVTGKGIVKREANSSQ